MIYTLSLDMAKELAMVAKNDAGKRSRRYFIDCERRAMGIGEASETEIKKFVCMIY